VPRTRSAKKQLRRGKISAARNKSQRSALRTAVKKVRAVTAGSPEAAAAYAVAAKLLDRAGRKRLIHPNTAARQKSRLAKLATRK
jgi:small subunit ribosomal protein S20